MKGNVSIESLLAVAIVGVVGWIVARFAAALFRAGAGDGNAGVPSTGWSPGGDDTHHHGGWDGAGHGGHASGDGLDGGASH